MLFFVYTYILLYTLESDVQYLACGYVVQSIEIKNFIFYFLRIRLLKIYVLLLESEWTPLTYHIYAPFCTLRL